MASVAQRVMKSSLVGLCRDSPDASLAGGKIDPFPAFRQDRRANRDRHGSAPGLRWVVSEGSIRDLEADVADVCSFVGCFLRYGRAGSPRRSATPGARWTPMI